LVRNGRVLIGGDPQRALRLSDAGAQALKVVRTGADRHAAAGRLARTLVDSGIAHPQPRPVAPASVTVVIPVRDRPRELEAALVALTGARVPVLVVDDGSLDAAAVARACNRHGAGCVRLPVSRGPAAARNAALAELDTTLIAFLDSDCIPPGDWLDRLVGHFADPLVAAVAPRVRGIGGSGTAGGDPVSRFSAARSPVDLGPWPARVRPGGRVAYVPTAALIVRRAALGRGFDAALRYGEDVDLVWRMHDAGWRVRYDPAVVVDHREPERWRPLVARRFRYGTSAAALAQRHQRRLAPFVVHPAPLVVVVALLAGRPRTAGVIIAGQSVLSTKALRRAGVPAVHAAALPTYRAGQMGLTAARTATTLALPLLLAAMASRRARGAALALMVSAPLADWLQRRPGLDPVRWTALSVADDAAYGAGVWWGSLRARTVAPLRPVRTHRTG
jgi:mycofactocin system glycosyltransferase